MDLMIPCYGSDEMAVYPHRNDGSIAAVADAGNGVAAVEPLIQSCC